MSATPPKKDEAEAEVVQSSESPENPMDPRDAEAQGQGLDVEVKEQDRWLPIANVARIMKSALPENAKIAKEAKECMQECVSEFISFITSEASEKCQQEKRKTVNGEDILFAMTSLGFENYSEALKIYLARYREETLLQTQKTSGPGSGTATNATAGANSVAGSTAPYDESHATGVLSTDGLDHSDDPATAFGYPVQHNGNGVTDY